MSTTAKCAAWCAYLIIWNTILLALYPRHTINLVIGGISIAAALTAIVLFLAKRLRKP